MLSNYQEGGYALLQSFLLGQVELKRTLQGPGMEQVRQRIIAGYHLRPLGRDELQGYVEHRLALVGWESNPTITAEAYDRIYEGTGGVPRRVNSLVDRLLLFGALEQLNTLDDKQVESVLKEVSQEVGRSQLGSEEEDPPVDSPLEVKADGDLAARVTALEQRLEMVRSEMRRDRKLLKKAILLQMEMGEDDEFE